MLNKSQWKAKRREETDVCLVVDMSGSMSPRRFETIREINRYLDSLRRDGNRYRVSLTTFNERANTIVTRKPIQDVGEMEESEYRPYGWTRLLDAVGRLLDSYQYWRENKVLFVVITDGEENDSREYTFTKVRNMIDARESQNFQFVYLGSGPGAWQIGRHLGANISVSTDWNDPRNTENIYASLSQATKSYQSTGMMNVQAFNTGSTSGQVTSNDEKLGSKSGTT